jgi:predicted DCC family thiol-disulfide oxidoreductase YuxK
MPNSAHQVFYDDLCPMCNAEITHYKKLTHLHPIDWVAISTSEEVINAHGLNKELVLKRIHAINNEGEVISGAAVFSLIWNSLKPYRWAGRIVETLHLIPILDFFYKYFAEWRYRRNEKKCPSA